MEIKTGIFTIFLFIGLLGVPNCTFAQENSIPTSENVLYSSLPIYMDSNSLNPKLASSSSSSSSSGSKSSSSSSSSSSSKSGSSSSSSTKKIHDGDDDSSDNSNNPTSNYTNSDNSTSYLLDNNNPLWFLSYIFYIVIFGVVGLVIWRFMRR